MYFILLQTHHKDSEKATFLIAKQHYISYTMRSVISDFWTINENTSKLSLLLMLC